MSALLFHNPRCSKSRATLALLNARNVEPEVVEYLQTPPDRRILNKVLASLPDQPEALVRTGERDFRESEHADCELTTERVVKILLEHPEWMQRPVLVNGSQARIGRPPERVLEIL